MKGSHKDSQAVTPVIAMLLMVGIMVILAGVFFAFSMGLGADDDPPPRTLFEKEGDGLLLRQAGNFQTWGEYAIVLGEDLLVGQTLCFGLNTAATDDIAGCVNDMETSSTPTESGEVTTSGTQLSRAADAVPVNGGDLIALCGTVYGVGTELADVSIKIRHIPSNSLVYEDTFPTLQACA